MGSLSVRTLCFVYAVSKNKNTLGQDPCTVGSILDASCRGLGKSTLSTCNPFVIDDDCYLVLVEYTYPPLINNTQYYPPPRASDLMCDCNTVMYRYETLSLKDDFLG